MPMVFRGRHFYMIFKLIGFNNFINYIPDRHIEGYGLNSEGIEELAKDKVKLLITIDCGIRDHKQIEHAKKHGIEIIITDHHEQSDGLPKAFAIINPKIKKSKYRENFMWHGCGLENY